MDEEVLPIIIYALLLVIYYVALTFGFDAC